MTQAVAWLSIVGIGEDGWDGLGVAARRAIERADVLVGGARHLALVPQTPGERIAWPSPMLPFVDEIVEKYRSRAVTVLASGDPMLCGVGAVFGRRIDPSEFEVIPHVSALALACGRLGWPSDGVMLVSAVARPLDRLRAFVQPDRRVVVYSENGTTPAAVATLLSQCGYGLSKMSVFERLGGPNESRRDGVAEDWTGGACDDLNLVAVHCVADAATEPLATVPGLPNDAFETDGNVTKREVRAATLARLVPLAGQLLWDVGAGSGSIGIEWMRSDPSSRAFAFERNGERAHRIERNARRLGVPGLRIISGTAPGTFEGAERPHAIFIGGGLGTPHLVEACWESLARGGRLVANAVTVEGEVALASWHAKLGGELLRISVSHADAIGSMLCFRPSLPVTQWAVTKW